VTGNNRERVEIYHHDSSSKGGFLIANNNKNRFSKDTKNERGTRLLLLSENIAQFQPVLNLTVIVFDWAISAYQNWDQKRVQSGVEWGEQQVAFETFQRLFREVREYFIALKKLLLALIKHTKLGEEVVEEYGLHVPVSRARAVLKNAIEQFKDTSARLRAAGDARVLSEIQVNDLVQKGEDMDAAWHNAQKEKQESMLVHKELRELFREDTLLLRLVHTSAVIALGKDSPDLSLLGFAPVTRRKGHTRIDKPANFVFVWNDPELTFTWDPCEKATSYQLAYTEDDKTWNELYAGADTTNTYAPPAGIRTYKVRARNVHGFSDWSETVCHP